MYTIHKLIKPNTSTHYTQLHSGAATDTRTAAAAAHIHCIAECTYFWLHSCTCDEGSKNVCTERSCSPLLMHAHNIATLHQNTHTEIVHTFTFEIWILRQIRFFLRSLHPQFVCSAHSQQRLHYDFRGIAHQFVYGPEVHGVHHQLFHQHRMSVES